MPLASIQIVERLTPIEGADRIEAARVLGWTTVVKKSSFREGDTCCFIEVDSIVPDRPWSAFLGKEGFRVKSMRLRGVLSQGLAIPVHEVADGSLAILGAPIGADLTEALGIQKYTRPVPMGAEFAGPFPAGVPKTDEPLAQSRPDILAELAKHDVYATVKCDGTSATYLRRYGELWVCSRNNRLAPPGTVVCPVCRGEPRALCARCEDTGRIQGRSVYWEPLEHYPELQKIPEELAVQGEVCGPGVQGNGLGLDRVALLVFDVFDVGRGRYFSWKQLLEFTDNHGLDRVPSIGHWPAGAMTGILDQDLRWLAKLADGHYPAIGRLPAVGEKPVVLNPGTRKRMEGMVLRSAEPLRLPPYGTDRLSVKWVNPDHAG